MVFTCICAVARATSFLLHLIIKKFIVKLRESQTSCKGPKMCIFHVFHESSNNDYSFIINAIEILFTSSSALIQTQHVLLYTLLPNCWQFSCMYYKHDAGVWKMDFILKQTSNINISKTITDNLKVFTPTCGYIHRIHSACFIFTATTLQ